MTFYQVPTLNLRDNVVEQIRQAIIERRLEPNDHIAEALLTKQLGVSRTPVREALILLEREGLVVAYPNRGFYVRAFTIADVGYIFSMRVVLENFAAEVNISSFTQQDFETLDRMIEEQRSATLNHQFAQVRNIDMNFHRYLVAHSQHPILLRDWTELVAQIVSLLYQRADSVAYDELLAIRDHITILDGYKQRDLGAVQRANREINNRVCDECVLAVQRSVRK